jgi:hypothetical protein
MRRNRRHEVASPASDYGGIRPREDGRCQCVELQEIAEQCRFVDQGCDAFAIEAGRE